MLSSGPRTRFLARKAKPTPTDAELEILKVLWETGVCTVRDVHDQIAARRDISYASVSKMISLMIRKGMVDVVDARRPQRVRAAQDRATTLESLMTNLRNAVFGGSIREMLSHLLGRVSDAEIDQSQQAIDAARKQRLTKNTGTPRGDKKQT